MRLPGCLHPYSTSSSPPWVAGVVGLARGQPTPAGQPASRAVGPLCQYAELNRVGVAGLALLLAAAVVAAFGMLPKQSGNEPVVWVFQ